MPSLGEVVWASTRQRIGKPERGFKYHFCICTVQRLYLFVCSRGFKFDFPITKADCPGLPNDMSYLSLASYKHAPDHDLRGVVSTCVVSDDFMERFRNHVLYTDILAERERDIILAGIAPRCGGGP